MEHFHSQVFHKVDSFLISDVSETTRTSTTKDLVNLAFDLRTEVIIFEVTHKPGYQLKARYESQIDPLLQICPKHTAIFCRPV